MHNKDQSNGHHPLTLMLGDAQPDMLSLVGGKALNLGELLRGGFPVPDGFCVTTAAYQMITEQTTVDRIIADIARTDPAQLSLLSEYAQAARDMLATAEIPASVSAAIRGAYHQLSHDSSMGVAVRSSATAEDLPFASFAGQQDTYLNIVGADAVLEAVRRCWASLWTERAVAYRASKNIDPHTVRLAVIVQQMIDSVAAGVMFTANPITGRRHQAVIDASIGLGEAVVSGAVNPDHFIVDLPEGKIVERHLGDKRLSIRAVAGGGTQHFELTEAVSQFSISDPQVIELARLAARVEDHYSAPQDTEWAFDEHDHLWLTQARPITTLYPLPNNAPASDDNLRVYFSLNVAQGVYQPFTPMGMATLRLMFASWPALLGKPVSNPISGPSFLLDAGERLFVDITPVVRSTIWQPFIVRLMGQMEARSGVVFKNLVHDPRLPIIRASRLKFMRSLLPVLWRLRIAPFWVVQAALNPAATRRRLERLQNKIHTLSKLPAGITASERLDYFERMFADNTARFIFNVVPIAGLIFGLPALLKRLLGDQATDAERQAVLRAVPHNPTTEMDLTLWALAQKVHDDATAASYVREHTPEQLGKDYQQGVVPPTLQQGLAGFLDRYGHRGVAEIDLGLPRWADDPTHIMGMLRNYLQIEDPQSAPDHVFQRAGDQALAMAAELTQRARKRGWLRAHLVAFCTSRMRELVGLREVPKFDLILLMEQGRRILLPVGEELARAGRLEAAEDIFFVDTVQARKGLAGSDLRALVQQHKSVYAQEMERRHIPRILLSDGTEPENSLTMIDSEAASGVLQGTPASAGLISAKARVILNPAGAKLEPGEILVAPSTDPGWTPLFLTAAGLVMEMGGPMSHGAVVAREYGIPAVVGVAGATHHIETGQQITVDGSSGRIVMG